MVHGAAAGGHDAIEGPGVFGAALGDGVVEGGEGGAVLAGSQRLDERVGERGHLADIEQGRAFAAAEPAAGEFAQDGQEGGDRADWVAVGVAGVGGLAAAEGGGVAGGDLERPTHTPEGGKRPFRLVAGQGEGDDVWAARGDVGEGETGAVAGALREVLDTDVAGADQRLEEGAVGGVAQVHGHRALAEVDRFEGPGDALVAEVAGYTPEVAADRLALDDAGAVVGEEAGRERSSPVLRDLDDNESRQGSGDGRGEGGGERLAESFAVGVRFALDGGVLDAVRGARREIAVGAGCDGAAAMEVGRGGEGVEGENGGVGEAGLLGESHDFVDGAGAEPGGGCLPDGGSVLAARLDGGVGLDDVLAADHGAEARPLGGDGLVGADLAIGAGDNAEGVGDAAGWPHGGAHDTHGEG